MGGGLCPSVPSARHFTPLPEHPGPTQKAGASLRGSARFFGWVGGVERRRFRKTSIPDVGTTRASSFLDRSGASAVDRARGVSFDRPRCPLFERLNGVKLFSEELCTIERCVCPRFLQSTGPLPLH
jgi:hypothetical protein